MSALAPVLLHQARRAGALIATAESCTGGRLAGAITDVPGASDIFDRGFVTYSNRSKQKVLGVTSASLEGYGAVSESVAWEMADGALARSEADLAVSITGIAGPGSSENKPEGRVCFGLARRGARTRAETRDFGALGRTAVRAAAVDHALAMLIATLREMNEAAAPTEDA
jgi:nicotinamide-nucleotide amidase